ncbi:VCBS repeat-containing protein [Micromonospora sp. NPDC049257]|uniref:C40 family peptidase n=1 Tax=Micromonospora sp. NPDC049257 TaxID=3155771 RepID=UPI00342C3D34
MYIRRTLSAAATAAVLLGLTLASSPASAAPASAQVSCSSHPVANNSEASATMNIGANLKKAPYSECGNVRYLNPTAEAVPGDPPLPGYPGLLPRASQTLAVSTTPTPCGDNGADKPVTRTEALTRARSWTAVGGIPYSQYRCYKNQYGDYRTDCSGFVSMAWGLGGSGSAFWTGNLDTRSHPIPRSDLKTGDALLRHVGDPHLDHVALFVKWSDNAHTAPVVIEQTGSSDTIERTWSASNAGNYTPVRYDKISEPASDPADDGTVQFADLTGDGQDEIVAIRPNGDVYAYRNRGWSDPKVYDGPDNRLVASGFTDPLRTKFADVDGDGRAEIIAVFSNGDVHAYHNQGWDAPQVYDGANQKLVASGFTDPLRTTFADVDGDGRAEIIAVFSNGDVHAYRNQGWDAAKVYDGANQKLVASGFTDTPRTKFADIDGDGRAEIIALYGNGEVHTYRNQGWDAAKVYDGANQRVVASGFTDPRSTKFGRISADNRDEIVSIYANGDVHAYVNQGWGAAKVYDGANQRVVASGFAI